MKLDDTASAWVARAMVRLQNAAFVEADYDEVGADAPLETAVDAVRLFRHIVTGLAESTEIVPLLVLPLSASQRLLTTPPSLDRKLLTPWRVGPGVEVPAYYLTRVEFWAQYDGWEEYRVPMPSEHPELKDLCCYYRSFRDPEAQRLNWEYARGFFIRPR